MRRTALLKPLLRKVGVFIILGTNPWPLAFQLYYNDHSVFLYRGKAAAQIGERLQSIFLDCCNLSLHNASAKGLYS